MPNTSDQDRLATRAGANIVDMAKYRERAAQDTHTSSAPISLLAVVTGIAVLVCVALFLRA